jgi:hypothetical protein
MFNNNVFNSAIIGNMAKRDKKEERQISEQSQRLYIAAEKLKNAKGKTAIAALLGASYYTVHNWEERGISEAGLLAAREFIGCDTLWLRDGTGDMVHGIAPAHEEDLSHAVEILRHLGRLPGPQRMMAVEFTRNLADDLSAANNPKIRPRK